MKAILSYNGHVNQSFCRRGAFFLLFFLLTATVLSSTACLAQSSDASGFSKIRHFKTKKIVLKEGWKFHPGDKAAWAEPGFDDSQWQPIDPTQDIHYLTQLREAEIGWFRLHLKVDSALLNTPLAMAIFQRGASEIFLDGKLIHKLGVVSKNPDEEVLFNPNYTPYSFQLTGGSEHVLAVRYSFMKGNPYLNFLGIWGGNPAMVIEVKKADDAIRDLQQGNSIVTSRLVGKGVFLLFLALLHLFFYITYPVKRANLYYSLFTLSLSMGYSLEYAFRFMPREGQSFFIIGLISSLFFAQFIVWGLLAIYSHARQKTGWFFRLVVFCVFVYIVMWRWPYEGGYYFSPFLIFIGAVDAIRVSHIAVRNKIAGSQVIFYGWLGYLIFFAFFFMFGYNLLPRFTHDTAITLDLAIFCGAVTFSALLAVEYAQSNRSLQASLVEVEVQRLEAMKMQELDKTKSNFFANISHEFRTPLTLIIGSLEKLLQKGNPSSEQVTEYHLIQRNANRLLQLINQLLDLSKLEAGRLKVEKQAGELKSFLDRLAGSFASLFESKGVCFHYTLPDEPVHVYFDPDKLEKVLSNLLYNAYKFTDPGGDVKLTVSLQTNDEGQSQLRLRVQDTGIGISMEQMSHIFRRFYQADETAVRPYEGTGIGLALVKELVELMQGTITCTSTVGVGTTFTVRLPLVPAPLEEGSLLIRQAEVPPLLSIDWSSTSTTAATADNPLYKVLVIEDNPELRSFIMKSLAEEYEVMEAANGRLGFEYAIETIPDLIISDVMMPELDGVSLCKKLKKTESTSHIPVILLTARADHESKIAGLETGADNYVVKPFKVDELLVRVRNLIETRLKLRERYNRSLTLQPSDVVISSVDERFLQKVMAVMEANLSNCTFDVEMFSREVGMSRVQLHRKLTALTDQSASSFIRTFRLKRAACLLEQDSGNISEVAFAVGFNSPTYFTKCFKEQYGCAPSEFVASLKQK